jgi:CRP/FNR family transcriptional regulator, cyclic AMP receptor protein
MDTSGFFDYPNLVSHAIPARDPGLLADGTEEEWDAVLAATETLRFAPDDVVLAGGESDRAVYLLLDGRLRVEEGGVVVSAPATVGQAAFLDDRPRAVTLRAITHGEVARLGYDAFEALAARHPRLGRRILVDLGRTLLAPARAAGAGLPGWTG